MGNSASSNEDFSKAIDFCKQLKLLHFVWEEATDYATYLRNSSSPNGSISSSLKTQFRQLEARLENLNFEEQRVMFSIKRVLFRVPYRVWISHVELANCGNSSKAVFCICFEAKEIEGKSESGQQEGEEERFKSKTYTTKRSFSEFLTLDERIRNLFLTEEEKQIKERITMETRRREEFWEGLEERAEQGVKMESDYGTQHIEEEYERGLDEETEDGTHGYAEKKTGKDAFAENGPNNTFTSYEALGLPELPGKRFAGFSSAALLALANERLPLLEAYLCALLAHPVLSLHEVVLQFLFSPINTYGIHLFLASLSSFESFIYLCLSFHLSNNMLIVVLLNIYRLPENGNWDESEGSNGEANENQMAKRFEMSLLNSTSFTSINPSPSAPSLLMELLQKEKKEEEEKIENNLIEKEEIKEKKMDKEIFLSESISFTSLMISPDDPLPPFLTCGENRETDYSDEKEDVEGREVDRNTEEFFKMISEDYDLWNNWSFLKLELAVCVPSDREENEIGGKNRSEEKDEVRILIRENEEEMAEREDSWQFLELPSVEKKEYCGKHDEKEAQQFLPSGMNVTNHERKGKADQHRIDRANQWVDRLDSRSNGKRKWKVISVEDYVLSTGRGELQLILRKCLNKQAKALMLATGREGGKTGAIIAGKKGVERLLLRTLSLIGIFKPSLHSIHKSSSDTCIGSLTILYVSL